MWFSSFFPGTASITAIISNPSNRSYATEGQNLTFVWTYILDGTVRFAQFNSITDSGSGVLIGKTFGPGVITIEPGYQARFRAQATNNRAELTILAVQLSDEGTYKLTLVSSAPTFISNEAKVIVHCKYWLKSCCMHVMSRSIQFDYALILKKKLYD